VVLPQAEAEKISVAAKDSAVFKVEMSERRLESLDCLRSSAGERVTTTTAAKTATIAITIRSSIRVKDEREEYMDG
jgi:hypothetical protein